MVLISVSMHMMTSQGHICVQCVTNGLQRNSIWPFTARGTVERTCHALAHTVGNVFRTSSAWGNIWIFTAVNTSALNVESVFRAIKPCQDTDEFIQERNRLNVLFVANDLQYQAALLCTVEFTVERNRTNVTCVRKCLVGLQICTDTWESTQERNRTSVHYVTKHSASPTTCRHINVMCTVTEDHMTALTVGSCLSRTLNWSAMFVFTLVQSRSHVDTVQSILGGMTISSDICLSHTMKVLGWHVTFVRRNSSPIMNFSSICYDITVWSHLFVMNVKSVSLLQLNWNDTSQYTPLSNSFAAAYVVKILSWNIQLKCTLESVFRTCDADMCVFLPAGFREAANCRYCFYSQAKKQVFRPAGATRCTDSGQTLHDRQAPGSASLCKISHQSVQRGGKSAPKISKISIIGKESPRRGDSLDRFRKVLGAFYTTTYPTLVFQISCDSHRRLRSYCGETARR